MLIIAIPANMVQTTSVVISKTCSISKDSNSIYPENHCKW